MIKMVIVYDIVNNKSRKIINDILEGYGQRVNRSVFECQLKNQKAKQKLIKQLNENLNPKRDSLRIYTMCQKCIQTSQELCDHSEPFVRENLYFI